ncbi:hypothetical protein [Hornefia butyriciproducens]|uniref:Uncharacterized protein n=1 Tax=Hornefia butyriciproducens TaxID=2652293 RepID=A0A6L5Y7V2_9FIRM|nr:hypothetical protein [Hornefia butyriciproducens]MST52706.1 hypothetical protein [Hornefia butyriciproducens]
MKSSIRKQVFMLGVAVFIVNAIIFAACRFVSTDTVPVLILSAILNTALLIIAYVIMLSRTNSRSHAKLFLILLSISVAIGIAINLFLP